jgi:transaldolase
MKIFIDTANIDEIKELHGLGIIDGVTTNPTLLAKEGKDPTEQLLRICELVDGPISAEAISTEADAIVEEARQLAKMHKNIVVKIPLTPDGIKATSILSKEGVKVNQTLIFSATQALLAAKVGAAYVSPFIGRLDDVGCEGMNMVREILTIFENYGYGAEVIVASVRHPMHVLEAAVSGAHIVTAPYQVIKKLFLHPLTDIGIERFLKDWEKLKK